MRLSARGLQIVVAATAAAALSYVGASLPPPATRLGGAVPKNHVTGGYHLHTVRSDGSGTVDEVAAAASRAGLSFIIVTDHGDARRVLDPPSYKHGVLYIDAVEVSTTGGHIVALGLTAPAPYPLAGNPRDVLEDIHRLGGAAVIAHPDSATVGLRYRGPDSGFDGIEWVNVDSEWRDKSPRRVLESAAHYLIRPPESVASLFERPVRTLERWDRAARTGPVFGLAALDTHARIGWRATEEPRTQTGIERPTYEVMFRTLAQTVILDAPLSGDAANDAARVLRAITSGHSYSIVRAFADPASLNFSAAQGDVVAAMGDRLSESLGVTTFRASVPQAPTARLVLLRDGQEVAVGQGSVERAEPAASGVYRIEAWLANTHMPWIVSNPITVGSSAAPVHTPDSAANHAVAATLSLDSTAWHVEHDPVSLGVVRVEDGLLRFEFRIRPGQPSGQYSAVVSGVQMSAAVRRIQFVARASQPMRVSLQLRQPGDHGGRRWRRSVYVGSTETAIVVPLQEFEPVESLTVGPPTAVDVDSLLFVIDTTNTLPGTAGALWLSDVALGS